MCGAGSSEARRTSGGNGEGDPPVPIPNTEVKPLCADGTWLETARESRSLPDPNEKAPRRSSGRLSLCLVLAALSWHPPLPLILVKKIVKTGKKEGIWTGHIEYDTQLRRAGHLGLMRSLPQSDWRENQDDDGPGTDTAIDPG